MSFIDPKQQILLQTEMLEEVISEYLERFAGSYTDSVYNAKGYEDYNYMRRCCDYLECDKVAIMSPRNLPAGLRNIGNTCYLNTILQLLFHINYLREKITVSENLPSKLLKNMQFLFGVLSVGKIPFADPTDIFEELRAGNPDVFAPGVQNDFHEVFTLLLDAIEEGYRTTAPEEARYIRKLFLGKMTTNIDFGDEKMTKMSEFNIINLDSQLGSLSRALQKWRKYQIFDFVTPNGRTVTANAENLFLETPALMSFFINRVGYREGKLKKNCRPFMYEDHILIAKAYQSEKTMTARTAVLEKEKEINEEKRQLQSWLKKVQVNRKDLQATIDYLKAKEAPLLSEPIVENPLGQQNRLTTLAYLKQELVALQQRMANVLVEVKQLEEREKQVWSQQNCERYVLWGVMVHEGTSAVYGHYKLCLLLGDEQWYEFNDKNVSLTSKEVIYGYRDRGEICCLFYRRPLLVCNAKKIPIPFPLKNAVGVFERQIKKDIDKARILQQLYQQTQSMSILLQLEMRLSSEERFQFFFKPVHYAISEKYPHEVCKGILLQEQVQSQRFLSAIKDKLISSDGSFKLRQKSFGVPKEYYEIKRCLTSFLDKQHRFVEIGSAYDELSRSRLNIESQKAKELLAEMKEAIILKGLYFLKKLSDYDCSELKEEILKLSEGLDRMLAERGESQFALVCISIKASILILKGKKKLIVMGQGTHQIQDYGEYFIENFKFWVKQRSQIGGIDETNYMNGAPHLTKIKTNQ